MATLSLSSHNPKLDPDPIAYLPTENLVEGVLYAGFGGEIGRVAIFQGVSQQLGYIAFQGYVPMHDGTLKLKTQRVELNATHGKGFRATERLSLAPAGLTDELLLIDWLVTQDLAHATLKLAELTSSRPYPGKEADISYYSDVIKLIRSRATY